MSQTSLTKRVADLEAIAARLLTDLDALRKSMPDSSLLAKRAPALSGVCLALAKACASADEACRLAASPTEIHEEFISRREAPLSRSRRFS